MVPAAADNVKPPLDDVMLSMDVVDTLRHEERIVERELNDETRRAQLIDRLREIYRGQGIEVPDRILEEGVKALEERRFVYEPPPPSLRMTLARLYVTRERWGRWFAGGLAGLAMFWLGWQAFYVWPRAQQEERTRVELNETLPQEFNSFYAAIESESNVASIRTQAARLRDAGLAAAKAGNMRAARQSAAELRALLDALRLTYEIRVVSRPGELSGLWRIPRVNPNSRNYYLVVEAIGEDGGPIERTVTNEENGARETVTKWAVRVSKPVFDAVQADKLDDGIIQKAVIGVKRRGELETDWLVDTQGGALTRW